MTSAQSELIHLYPTEIQIDYTYKRKEWQGIPILPKLDLELVSRTIQN